MAALPLHKTFHRWLLNGALPSLREAHGKVAAALGKRTRAVRLNLLSASGESKPWLMPEASPLDPHLGGVKEKADALILPFLLHGLSREAGTALLCEVSRQAPYLILMDYRQPERNLDFPAAWLIGGLEACSAPNVQPPHYPNHRVAWRQFMRQGGLEALVHAFCAHTAVPFGPLCRCPLCGGAASLLLMASPGL